MKKIVRLLFFVGCLFSLSLNKIWAATGVITGTSAYAWGENIGWLNFKASGSNVTVSDSGLTGYVWSSTYGWINLAPTTSGVTNTCAGTLGGKAWSQNLGWIDFTGATINSSGKFTGTIGTAGSTVGRINFDCTNCSVKTDWLPNCVTPTPTSAPATTTTSTGGGWAAPACTATKPGSAPTLLTAISGTNSVTLTWSKASNPVTKYLVAYGTRPGSIVYGNPDVGNENTTSYTVQGLSGGTRYYFKVKAIDDCMPGDWSNEMAATPGGPATPVPATGFVPISSIPSQLLDIALIVDQPQVIKASDLVARVTFVSFGSENTPVEMTFTIVDSKGKEYYRSVDKVTIQTEGVFNKTFKGLTLADGKYQLVLNTLYNTNIKDEFKQDFEVNSTTSVSPTTSFLANKPLMIGIGITILLLLGWLIWILLRRREEKKSY